MKTALELLNAYLDNVQDTAYAASLFAEDGALELPYLRSLDFPYRAEGPAAVKAFLDNVIALFHDFRFQHLRVFMTEDQQVFAEYEVITTTVNGNRPYHQLFMGRLQAEHGKIKLLREALDTVASLKALNPDENP